jgi:hypothetical protein
MKMPLPGHQRRAYERRLAQLEATLDRLSCWLVAADPADATKLCGRLEAIDIEVDLLREALAEG